MAMELLCAAQPYRGDLLGAKAAISAIAKAIHNGATVTQMHDGPASLKQKNRDAPIGGFPTPLHHRSPLIDDGKIAAGKESSGAPNTKMGISQTSVRKRSPSCWGSL